MAHLRRFAVTGGGFDRSIHGGRRGWPVRSFAFAHDDRPAAEASRPTGSRGKQLNSRHAGLRFVMKAKAVAVAAGVCFALFHSAAIANDLPDGAVVPPPLPLDDVDVYFQQRYVPPPNYVYRFVPYPTHFQRGHYYLWDYLNRPYSFTPEPIWREMFRGIRERIATEVHAIGVPGQAAGEYNYYREVFKEHSKRRREEK